MRGLRVVQMLAMVAVVSVGASKAHAIINLELEGGGGLNFRGPEAPLATGRVALQVLSLLDVGLRGEYAFGSTTAASTQCNSGVCGALSQPYQAWMVFPELRLKTPTPVIQFDLALGGGLGYLKGISINDKGIDSNGAAKPYAQIGIGFRLKIPTTDVYFRLEGSASLFTSVSGPDIGDGLNPGLLPVYQAQLMIGYDGIGF